ncbi:MAG TPA: VCBS repeat-containing protein, partial [Bacteroidia bacterium]|nr:VCBS repeat-containing protein [Bacteroidia bacterium]
MKYINTIIIIFLSIFFSFSQPNFCFKSQESYSTIVPWNLITSAASNVSFLEKGDFNKDGKLDYAFTVANNKVITYTGTGLGTFSLSNTYTLGSSGILPITSGDYNNDTNLDLIVASNFSNDITLLSGDGAGNFSISPIFTPTSQPRNLITDDVNNDGNKDLITFANDVLISLGNGNGNFNTPIALSSFVGLEGVCVDINNDSNKDLVIQSAGTLRIHLGNGAGNFTYTGGFPTGYSGWCTGIVSKDFNTDGNADIAIAT